MDQNSDLDWISAKYTVNLVNQAVPQPSSHFSPITNSPTSAQLSRVLNTSSICTYTFCTHYWNTCGFYETENCLKMFFFSKFNNYIMFLHQMENSLFCSFCTIFSIVTTLNVCRVNATWALASLFYDYAFICTRHINIEPSSIYKIRTMQCDIFWQNVSSPPICTLLSDAYFINRRSVHNRVPSIF